MKNLIASVPIYTKYRFTYKDFTMEAKISKGQITLLSRIKTPYFKFRKSKPEVIEAMAELMLQAVRLAAK